MNQRTVFSHFVGTDSYWTDRALKTCSQLPECLFDKLLVPLPPTQLFLIIELAWNDIYINI